MKYLAIIIVLLSLFAATTTRADEPHPALTSKVEVFVGGFFSARDFKATAKAGLPGGGIDPTTDFEAAGGLNDSPELLVAGVRWRFSENWDVSLQYWNSSRSGNAILQDTIEWGGLTFDVGVDISAGSSLEITRLVFSRRVYQSGPHSLKLAAGLHLLDTGAEISGVATLDDQSREFRRSAVSASLPIPNVGAWYSYSPNKRWLLGARADWLSADVGDYSGLIWNVLLNAQYAFNENFGVGLAYQYFEVDGAVQATNWNGQLRTRFDGPVLQLFGHF